MVDPYFGADLELGVVADLVAEEHPVRLLEVHLVETGPLVMGLQYTVAVVYKFLLGPLDLVKYLPYLLVIKQSSHIPS